MATETISAPTLAPRTRPLEVVVLGLCRTGTMSLKAALEKLGYENVYHMESVFLHPGHATKWTAAMEAKYNDESSKFSREQFDDLIGDYDAITDIPAAIFVPELISFYPDAKIILTTRSSESWYQSILSTIYASQYDPLKPWDRLWYPCHIASIDRFFNRFFDLFFYGDFKKWGKRVFEEHNERVRLLSPKERFLEYRVEQGWEPLCEFLGKDAPKDEPFPRINDKESWRKVFRVGEKWEKVKWVSGILAVAVPVIVASGLVGRRGVGGV